MSNEFINITNSIGKLYISIIMAFFMVIFEIVMYQNDMKKWNIKIYIPLIVMLLLFIYLYKTQAFIYDKDYLREMIEHHSMAILTSQEILKKSTNENVKKLASNIITQQAQEINNMKKLLYSL